MRATVSLRSYGCLPALPAACLPYLLPAYLACWLGVLLEPLL
jgi:hypothetical protein